MSFVFRIQLCSIILRRISFCYSSKRRNFIYIFISREILRLETPAEFLVQAAGALWYNRFVTEETERIFTLLLQKYPEAGCELDFGTPFQLLVSVILSAQCTDKRVNSVTEKLFQDYPAPADFAAMDIEVLKRYIFSCGFYNDKAKHIKQAAADILEKFGGRVPDNIEELQSLSGVGRKTANVVYAVAFGGQAIAVDTHVFRVANRLGLACSNTPLGTEKQLMDIVDPQFYSRAHHLLLFHGRYTCKSQKPLCLECGVSDYCKYYKGKTPL